MRYLCSGTAVSCRRIGGIRSSGTAVLPHKNIHGYTPISRGQANRFFTFISDTYETSSIIFTTNKEIVDWAEMMGDPVLTTAMLDRILHHAKCYSFRGESYRLKHPDLYPQGETGM